MRHWFFVGFIFLGLSAGMVCAADYQVEAHLYPNDLALDESAILEVSVKGKHGPDQFEVKLPDLKGIFEVSFLGDGSSLSVVNGHVSVTKSKRYQCLPKATGHYTFPAISLQLDWKLFQTKPIGITVGKAGTGRAAVSEDPFDAFFSSPASAPPPPKISADSFSLSAAVDRSTVYVGQALHYALRMRGPAAISGQPALPPFAGFLTQDLPLTAPETVRDSQGNSSLLSHLAAKELVPVRVGDIRLPPAVLQLQSPDGSGLPITSNSVRIRVLPIPSMGQAPDFSGAVGDFRLSAQLPSGNWRVGSPMSVAVALTGEGYKKGIQGLTVEANDGFQVIASGVRDDDAHISGRIFDYILVPKRSGRLLVPGMSLSYFNPQNVRFAVAKLSPQFVDVLPELGDDQSQSQGLSSDVSWHGLRPVDGGAVTRLPYPLHFASLFLIVMDVVLLGFLGVALARLSLPKRRLSKAQFIQEMHAVASRHEIYSVSVSKDLYRILIRYLQFILKRPVAQLTPDEWGGLLRDRGFSEDRILSLRSAVEALHRLEYAPDDGASKSLPHIASDLISATENLDWGDKR